MSGESFSPGALVRNPHVQSILASSALRRWRLGRAVRQMASMSREEILTLDDGTRLQGFFTPAENPQGLVVLLHGWEGSASSTYMLDAGWRMWREGFSVFRLNFRDHGDTHHLNRDIFHSCRIDEVVAGIARVQEQFPADRLLLAGFSLGGNFALRVGLRAPAANVELDQIFAVCPVLDPARGLEGIVSAPWFYNYYFMRKWRRSLRRKGELFPEHGITAEMLDADMLELTDRLVRRYTDFGGAVDYFDGYSIAGDRLSSLAVPATIIAAEDDPVIPAREFHELVLPSHAELLMLSRGGHCGFIQDLGLQSWVPEYIARRAADKAGRGPRQSGSRDARQPDQEEVTC